MKSESLDDLLHHARTAPRDRSEQAPPFFAQRVTARWLSAQGQSEGFAWEMFARRGVALSAAAMIFAVTLSAALLPGTDDLGELDYTADVFLLP